MTEVGIKTVTFAANHFLQNLNQRNTSKMFITRQSNRLPILFQIIVRSDYMKNRSAFFYSGFTSLLHIFYCQVCNNFQADQTSVSYLNVYLLIFISLKGSFPTFTSMKVRILTLSIRGIMKLLDNKVRELICGCENSNIIQNFNNQYLCDDQRLHFLRFSIVREERGKRWLSSRGTINRRGKK